jgi:hypothetical protein
VNTFLSRNAFHEKDFVLAALIFSSDPGTILATILENQADDVRLVLADVLVEGETCGRSW